MRLIRSLTVASLVMVPALIWAQAPPPSRPVSPVPPAQVAPGEVPVPLNLQLDPAAASAVPVTEDPLRKLKRQRIEALMQQIDDLSRRLPQQEAAPVRPSGPPVTPNPVVPRPVTPLPTIPTQVVPMPALDLSVEPPSTRPDSHPLSDPPLLPLLAEPIVDPGEPDKPPESGTTIVTPPPYAAGADDGVPVNGDPPGGGIPETDSPVEFTPRTRTPSRSTLERMSPDPPRITVEGAVDRFALAESLFATGETELCLSTLDLIHSQSLSRENQLWATYLRACSLRKLGRVGEAQKHYRQLVTDQDSSWIGELARWWLDDIEERSRLTSDVKRLKETIKAWEAEVDQLSTTSN